MLPNQHEPTREAAHPGSARIRWFVFALALAAVACAIVAVFARGDASAVFGGVALVFAVAAVWSGIEVAAADPIEPQFDLAAPPPVTPLPLSPVNETYEPDVPPNKSLARTRDE